MSGVVLNPGFGILQWHRGTTPLSLPEEGQMWECQPKVWASRSERVTPELLVDAKIQRKWSEAVRTGGGAGCSGCCH